MPLIDSPMSVSPSSAARAAVFRETVLAASASASNGDDKDSFVIVMSDSSNEPFPEIKAPSPKSIVVGGHNAPK